MLRSGLDEVELALLEAQVGAVGVEEIAEHLLALVPLQLLDQAERLLGHDDPVGRHARDLLGPPGGPGLHGVGLDHLGEDVLAGQLTRLDGVAGQQQSPGQHRPSR